VCVVHVSGADALVPALELVQLGLFLFQLGVRELLGGELVLDLSQELGALVGQLRVFGVPSFIPGAHELRRVWAGERLRLEGQAFASNLLDQRAEALDGGLERLGVWEGDEGLLKMQGARAANLAPHGDPRARGVCAELVGHDDPSHRGSVTRVTNLATVSLQMDYSLYKTINGLSGSSFADGLLKVLANDLPAVLVVLVALAFLIPWRQRRRERRSGAVLATASAGLALLINQPIAHAVERMRPYLAHPAQAHLLISRSHDPSFPSDHATGAFALAFGIWLYDRTLGTILLIIGAVLAFSRVYVGTHYPGDVVAGALIGMAVAGILHGLAPMRRLIELVAARIGQAWDGLLSRVPGRARRTA